VRLAAPAVALVEQDNPVGRRIEEAPHLSRTAGARAAVHNYDRLSLWIAAGFPVNPISVAHVEHSLLERLNGRVKRVHVMTSFAGKGNMAQPVNCLAWSENVNTAPLPSHIFTP
jgi:hypothetical protein